MASKRFRMTARRAAVLAMYREAFYGGDPHMGMVGLDVVRTLREAGLVRPHMPWEEHLLRHSVPTLEGFAALDAWEARASARGA